MLFDLFLANGIRPPIMVWNAKDTAALWRRWNRATELAQVNTRWRDWEGGWWRCVADTGLTAGHSLYQVSLGSCTCPDNPKAPWGWCKHRLALWIRLNVETATPMSDAEHQQAIDDLYGKKEYARER